jgi:glucose-1-phosphate thymidylyltransferase
MQVLMLAGGFGTRLRPLTLYTPKQLLKLGETTIIEHLIQPVKEAGLEKITVAVNSAHAKIFQDNLDEYNLDWIIESPKEENEKLGAVGAIWNAKRFIQSEPTLIVGADNFAPGIDFEKIIKKHEREKNIATLILYELPDKNEVSKYGVVVVDGKKIIGFQEKPSVEEAKSQLISTAFYLVQPEFFKELNIYIKEKKEKGEKPDNLGDLWAWMVDKGIKVGYYLLDSYWSDIGSFRGYIEANKVLLKKKGLKFMVGKGCKIGNAEIGPNVLIGDNCTIGDGCNISHSIVFSRVKIDKNCTISGSIIDEDSKIGPNNRIMDQVVKRGSLIN